MKRSDRTIRWVLLAAAGWIGNVGEVQAEGTNSTSVVDDARASSDCDPGSICRQWVLPVSEAPFTDGALAAQSQVSVGSFPVVTAKLSSEDVARLRSAASVVFTASPGEATLAASLTTDALWLVDRIGGKKGVRVGAIGGLGVSYVLPVKPRVFVENSVKLVLNPVALQRLTFEAIVTSSAGRQLVFGDWGIPVRVVSPIGRANYGQTFGEAGHALKNTDGTIGEVVDPVGELLGEVAKPIREVEKRIVKPVDKVVEAVKNVNIVKKPVAEVKRFVRKVF